MPSLIWTLLLFMIIFQQATIFFGEVAEVEQNFCVLAVKLFENYGYSYSNSTPGGGMMASPLPASGNTSSGGGSEVHETARELISEFESPMSRGGWDSMIRAGIYMFRVRVSDCVCVCVCVSVSVCVSMCASCVLFVCVCWVCVFRVCGGVCACVCPSCVCMRLVLICSVYC